MHLTHAQACFATGWRLVTQSPVVFYLSWRGVPKELWYSYVRATTGGREMKNTMLWEKLYSQLSAIEALYVVDKTQSYLNERGIKVLRYLQRRRGRS